MVDPNLPRFNQSAVALLTVVAFVTGWWQLVPALAAVLAAGSQFGPRTMLFGRIYVHLVAPLLPRRGPVQLEPAAPPQFAQTMGAAALAAASVAFALGLASAGWALTALVSALALLAAATRWCVGCELFVLIARTRGRAA
ncbi:MAG TPA: DUF4395 domain-containing protein [Gaiellales bacterium]|nr:DUF4395 domain-containing protein [Gaiellales bacterium]